MLIMLAVLITSLIAAAWLFHLTVQSSHAEQFRTGIVEKIRTKDSAIAYGPYLVIGALVSLFWGDCIIRKLVDGQIMQVFSCLSSCRPL